MSIIVWERVMPLTEARPVIFDCSKCHCRSTFLVKCSEHISSRLLVDVPVLMDFGSASVKKYSYRKYIDISWFFCTINATTTD